MNGLERYFRWHGKLVATYPLLFLLATTITTVMFGLGLISFREEADLTALWVPVGKRRLVLVNSHWSRSYITALSLVESFPIDACTSKCMP